MMQEFIFQNIVNYFGRHCISLVYIDSKKTDAPNRLVSPETLFFIGVVITALDEWFLLTAGHVFEHLNERLQSGERRFFNCSLVDHFCMDAISSHPLPFINFQEAVRYHVYDDDAGIDHSPKLAHSRGHSESSENKLDTLS